MTKPWIAINLLTNETIGRFATDTEALRHCVAQGVDSVDIQYRPRAKRKTRQFPYNN